MPEKPNYRKDLWNTLFQKYYKDAILGLAAVFTKNGTLKIEFNHLKTAWGLAGETTTSAIEYLINNPVQVLKDANNALHEFDLAVDPPDGWEKAHVEISGFKPVMAVRDLRHEHLDKFVSVRGTILRKTEVKYKLTNAAFKCQRCGEITHMLQPDGVIIEPFECDNDVCWH